MCLQILVQQTFKWHHWLGNVSVLPVDVQLSCHSSTFLYKLFYVNSIEGEMAPSVNQLSWERVCSKFENFQVQV